MPPLRDEPSPVAGPVPDVLGVVHADLAAWRAAHPQATFAEIEAAVEVQLGRLRAQLISNTIPPPPTTAPLPAPPLPPRCATCAVPLEPRGDQRRTLRVVGDQPVTLERTYWTCPCCGEGLFPPG